MTKIHQGACKLNHCIKRIPTNGKDLTPLFLKGPHSCTGHPCTYNSKRLTEIQDGKTKGTSEEIFNVRAEIAHFGISEMSKIAHFGFQKIAGPCNRADLKTICLELCAGIFPQSGVYSDFTASLVPAWP